jgi:antitoxin YefM
MGKMKAVNYSELRNKLKANLDMVCEDQETLIIHRPGGKSVVMMSLDEYNSQKETEYLLSSPKNAEHIFKSIKQAEEGNTIEVTLEELQNFEK